MYLILACEKSLMIIYVKWMRIFLAIFFFPFHHCAVTLSERQMMLLIKQRDSKYPYLQCARKIRDHLSCHPEETAWCRGSGVSGTGIVILATGTEIWENTNKRKQSRKSTLTIATEKKNSCASIWSCTFMKKTSAANQSDCWLLYFIIMPLHIITISIDKTKGLLLINHKRMYWGQFIPLKKSSQNELKN